MMKLLKEMADKKIISEERVSECMKLSPGANREDIRKKMTKEVKRRFLLAFASVLVLAAAYIAGTMGKKQSLEIKRPELNENPETVKINFYNDDNNSDIKNSETGMSLKVYPREYSEEETDNMFLEVKAYLDEYIPLENESIECVRSDIWLPESIELYNAGISWISYYPTVLAPDGTVSNRELEEYIEIPLEGKVFFGDEFRIYETLVTVYPPLRTGEEEKLLTAMKKVAEYEADRNDDVLHIPEEVDGFYILTGENDSKKGLWIVLAAGVCLVALAVRSYFSKIQTDVKKRHREIEKEYPEFVTGISMLIVAGMPVRKAWKRVLAEYEEKKGRDYALVQEMKLTEREIAAGMSEADAYEEFGRRQDMISYRRIMSVLTQSLGKGVTGMHALMMQEAAEALEEMRKQARVKGEEAGTKLLIPMFMLLAVVFSVIIVPALFSL